MLGVSSPLESPLVIKKLGGVYIFFRGDKTGSLRNQPFSQGNPRIPLGHKNPTSNMCLFSKTWSGWSTSSRFEPSKTQQKLAKTSGFIEELKPLGETKQISFNKMLNGIQRCKMVTSPETPLVLLHVCLLRSCDQDVGIKLEASSK